MTTGDTVSFGDLLRRHRIAAALSQEALAERAGLSARTVSDLERGIYRAPHRDTVALLCGALGLSPQERAQLEATIARRHGALTDLPSGRGGVRRDLPIPPTPLVGRDHDVATVMSFVQHEDIRLVTLTGPGGVGKTRLGLQVAAALRSAFADGVVFVALAAIDDPGLVPAAIAQALDVKEVGGRAVYEQVEEYLRTKRLLLLLDNFEQVLTAAQLVADLLAGCPDLTVLATSRTPLRVQGEQEYLVPSLKVPDPQHLPSLDVLSQYDAVRLFVARAQQVKADFTLTTHTAPVAAAICARLDGLPLAIELAAARVRLFPPQMLLARLSRRLTLLVGGPRDLPQRQQTLRATLDWSYSLLTPAERTLFARLAVFVGGRTLEAIEEICNPEGTLDVLAGMEALLQQSLLRQESGEGEPRYMMLETIHEYAWERLDASGDVEELSRRHALYFLDLAQAAESELMGPEQGVWLALLEQEHANVRAALSWARERGEGELGLRLAGALWRFWHMRSHLSEGRRWLEGMLAQVGDGLPAGAVTLRAKALRGAAELAFRQGDYGQAVALGEASLSLYREAADRTGLAALLNLLGNVAAQQGHFERSVELHEEVLALRRELGDSRGIAGSLDNLGIVAFYQGDYGRATALHQEALALCRDLGDRWGSAYALDNLGVVAFYQGDYGRATTLHAEALALCRELGDKLRAIDCLEGLAGVASAQGQAERAARLFGAAEATRRLLGAPLSPSEQRHHEHLVAAVRTHLDEQSFVAAWAAGQALSLEQAIAEALWEEAPA